MLEEIDARHEHAIARLAARRSAIEVQRDDRPPREPRDALDQAWEHSLVAQEICRRLEIEFVDRAVKRVQSRIATTAGRGTQYAALASRPSPARRYEAGRGGDRRVSRDAGSAAGRARVRAVRRAAAVDGRDRDRQGSHRPAQRIAMSLRKDKQFVAVNVTAVPQTMFEREFFGHVRGAFSGADMDRARAMQPLADGGTLFLDEIGDLPSERAGEAAAVAAGGLRTSAWAIRTSGTRTCGSSRRRTSSWSRRSWTRTFREDLYYRICDPGDPDSAAARARRGHRARCSSTSSACPRDGGWRHDYFNAHEPGPAAKRIRGRVTRARWR